MLTLDRYIARQVVVPALAGLALLLLLFSVFTAVRLLRGEATGNLALHDILWLVVAHDLSAMEVLLPSAFFAALVMSMSTWHRDGEAYAAYASGAAPGRVSQPLWAITLLVFALVAVWSIWMRPLAYELRYEINARASAVDSTVMRDGHFYKWEDGFVIKARRVHNDTPNLEGVFAHVMPDVGAPLQRAERIVVRAERGHIEPMDRSGLQRIQFLDGVSHAFDESGARITEFSRLEYLAQRAEPDTNVRRRALDLHELTRVDNSKYQAEYQWRFTLPLAAGLMLLIGIELSRLGPGASPYPRYATALITYVATFTAMNVTMSAVENATLPLVPGVFGALVVPALLLLLTHFRFGRL